MTARFKELYGRALTIALETCGQTAIEYYPKAGGSFEITGVFDQKYETVEASTESLVTSIQLVLGIKLSDLPVLPKENDKVLIDSKSYKVVDCQEDGQGGASLMLHEVKKRR